MIERDLGSNTQEAYRKYIPKIKNNKETFEKISTNYIREDSHWGCDLEVIKTSLNELLEKEPSVRWLDIGCGTGFHLSSIGELYPEIKAVGIDYSPSMLAQARAKIEKLELQNITLEERDISKDSIRDKYNLITFLNNGFGNLYRDGTEPEEIRNKSVRAISDSLNRNGYFILSVYNKEKLDINYGSCFRLLENKSNITKGDLFVEYIPKNTIKPILFYSHWFSEKEVRDLAGKAGLKMDFLERRMSRFLARYKKI